VSASVGIVGHDEAERDPARLVTRHREELLAGLLDYLRQPGESATGYGFPEATERALVEVRRAGLSASVLPTAGRPAVVGHHAGPPGTPRVLIYGHYDVQPPGPRELWRTEPYTPTIHNGRIWCRGSADNKGQHYAHLQALRLLLERDGGLPCTVTVLLDGEEEVGSPHLPDLIREHGAALACDLVIWSDGPVHESGRWCVLHGVRGIMVARLTARAGSKPMHSGNWGNVAPNPAWDLVHALGSLRDATGAVTIDGFYDDIEPLPPLDRQALDRLPVDLAAVHAELGVDRLEDGFAGLGFNERLVTRPTLTINGITGGDLARTIIPDVVEARIDVRLVAGQDPWRVFDRVREHLRRHAPRVEVTLAFAVPPSRTPLDNPYTGTVAKAIAQTTGAEPLLVPALGGTLPDHVWTRLLGVPSLGVPFANADEANHAPNENLELDRYFTGIALSMEMLTALGATV
jgi:acetylornithine deacetylase/succinyl-diaminopimelate desuccinylase-like protein